MTPTERAARQAVVTAYHGKRVDCSAAQYPEVRRCLVRSVKYLVLEQDEEAAERVMLEVLRLDAHHGLPLQEESA